MEPPAKRPRLSLTPQTRQDDEDDELSFGPQEISQRRDPGYQLQQDRAFAANRLKSTFEYIFEKYERDFSEVGDEIDLRTGEIIIDNGHISAMRNEKDAGGGFENDEGEDEGMLLSEAFGPGSEMDNMDDEDEARILSGRTSQPQPEPEPQALQTIAASALQKDSLPTPARLASEHRLSSLAVHRHAPANSSPLSRNHWELDNDFVDPAWRTPQLPQTIRNDHVGSGRFNSIYQLPAMDGSQSVWASDSSAGLPRWPSSPLRPGRGSPVKPMQRQSALSSLRLTRGLLRPSSENDNDADANTDDDEDEILKGISSKSSPLKPAAATNTASADGEQRMPNDGPRTTGAGSPSRSEKPPKPGKKRNQKTRDNKKPSVSTESGAAVTQVKSRPKTNNAAKPTMKQHTANPPPSTKSKKQGLKPAGAPKTNAPSHETVSQDKTVEGDDAFEGASYRRKGAQTIVVDIPSRVSAPDSYVRVDDDLSPAVSDREGTEKPPTPLERDSNADMPVDSSPREQEVEADTATAQSGLLDPGSPQHRPPALDDTESKSPEEQFHRNEIDPAYELSDEDNIPVRKSKAQTGGIAEASSQDAAAVTDAKLPDPPRPRGPGRPRKYPQAGHDSRLQNPKPKPKHATLKTTPSTEQVSAEKEEHPASTQSSNGLEETPAPVEGMSVTEEISVAQEPEALSPMDVDLPSPGGHVEAVDGMAPTTSETLATRPRRFTRDKPRPSYDVTWSSFSLGPEDEALEAQLDAIIERQNLLEEEDADFTLPNANNTAGFETPKPALRQTSTQNRSSARHSSKSVRFAVGEQPPEAEDGRPWPKIITTPPIKEKSQSRPQTTVHLHPENNDTPITLEDQADDALPDGAAALDKAPSPRENETFEKPASPKDNTRLSASNDSSGSNGANKLDDKSEKIVTAAAATTTTKEAVQPVSSKQPTASEKTSPATVPTTSRMSSKKKTPTTSRTASTPSTLSTRKKASAVRRSLLSLSLSNDSDDDDPLTALSLLASWTQQNSDAGTPPPSSVFSASNENENSPSARAQQRRHADQSGHQTPNNARSSLKTKFQNSTPPAGHSAGFGGSGGIGRPDSVKRRLYGGMRTPTKTKSTPLGSPTGSLVSTPNGHLRRCGLDGFRCERDFCFTCLSG